MLILGINSIFVERFWWISLREGFIWMSRRGFSNFYNSQLIIYGNSIIRYLGIIKRKNGQVFFLPVFPERTISMTTAISARLQPTV